MAQDSDQALSASPDSSSPTPAVVATAAEVASSESQSGASDEVRAPQFSSMQPTLKNGAGGSMDRFFDVHVPVWAELGRVEMPLGELMKLDEGAVLRLDRPVGEPVDLVSQGVKLARGEVVVIDDCFAIRIKEIEKSTTTR